MPCIQDARTPTRRASQKPRRHPAVICVWSAAHYADAGTYAASFAALVSAASASYRERAPRITHKSPITLYNWSQSSSHTPVFQFRPSYLPQCTSGAMPYSFRAYASSACLPHPERPAQACCREPDSSIVK